MQAAKAALRAQLTAMRRAQGGGDEPALRARVLALPELQSATRVLLYAAMRGEVPTEPLAHALLARGVSLAVPRITPEGLVAAPFDRWEDLTPGAFRILTSAAPAWDGGIDVVVVPGVAFTPRGDRLGLGRGDYDRFLSRTAVARKLALAWDFQLLDEIPTEAHDQRMDLIVTPTKTVWTNAASTASSAIS
jgi:5-formyltetrahydrofolate cyclo-ligase